MTGEDHPPGNRFDEVADAATRAFRLLPAPPQDVMTCGRADLVSSADHHRPRHGGTRSDELVLTIVELLRQLMERQALQRVDAGGLTEEQEERLGETLMILHDRMIELCARYDLSMQDLNLDLGPLGTLLPPTE